MNCCLLEPRSIVLCARISIHTRMFDCERNVLHVRIAVNVRMVVCGTHENGSHRCLWTVVPSVRIVILCARVASCSTSILHRRIAVCRSYRHLREPSFQARENHIVVFSGAFWLSLLIATSVAISVDIISLFKGRARLSAVDIICSRLLWSCDCTRSQAE